MLRSLVPATLLLALACAPVTDTPDSGTDAGTAVSLELNDVSILYPLPPRSDSPGWLAPLSEGTRGPLLPRAIFDAIPGFPVVPADGLSFTRMRVLAARFDPCGGPRGACEPQLRLVMQPMNTGTARDSALHVFYKLTETEFAKVYARLVALKELAPEATGRPLEVHPALVAQGMEGAYATALNELILSFAGEQNLSRMTFFLRAPPTNEVWFFGGFDVADGVTTEMDIAGIGKSEQRVIHTPGADGSDFDFLPTGDEPEDGSVLRSVAARDAASADERRASFASYLRVENPKRRTVEELSCAACHVSTHLIADAKTRYGLDPADFPEDTFSSDHDLTPTTSAAATPSSLRAFGWFRDEAMISTRTVNETAAVLEHLAAHPPGK